MRKSASLAACLASSLLLTPAVAQNTNGGDGGRGGGVICNNCTINGGSLNGGGGGNGGSAMSSPDAGPQTSAAHITSFRIEIRLMGGQEILSRNWRRAQNRWVEIYPEGKKEYFNILGTSTVKGCKGTVASNDGSHKVFIPSPGCEGMPFYIKDGSNAWGFASEMYDVR